MKNIIAFTLLFFAGAAIADEKVLVSKDVQMTLFFRGAQPFYAQNEHGGSCFDIEAEIVSARSDESNRDSDYYPVIAGSNRFTTACVDDFDWRANDKRVAWLNSFVKESRIDDVQVHYELIERDNGDTISLSESIEFRLPNVDEPLRLGNGRQVHRSAK